MGLDALFGAALVAFALSPGLLRRRCCRCWWWVPRRPVPTALSQSLMQRATSDAERGAAMGIWAFAVGFGPIGHLVGGCGRGTDRCGGHPGAVRDRRSWCWPSLLAFHPLIRGLRGSDQRPADARGDAGDGRDRRPCDGRYARGRMPAHTGSGTLRGSPDTAPCATLPAVAAVALAQSAEHWIVAPEVTGSIPVGHPTTLARRCAADAPRIRGAATGGSTAAARIPGRSITSRPCQVSQRVDLPA